MTHSYVPRRAPRACDVTVRGLRHHVTQWAGSDPEPVFLLHGWMDTGDTFQFLVDAMPDRRTCIAPDWRGFGRSEWPADGYWFPDYYADLEALLDHFAPGDRVTLVGHSMGGNIATMYAGIRPERVRRVVCIEGFGLLRTRPEQAPGRYREWLGQVREPPKFARFPSVESFAHLLARRNPRLTPERAAFIAAAWTERLPDGGVQVRSDPAHKRVNPVLYRREEAEACWREIEAPVLYCCIPGASHMAHHEQPELLAREIEAFFERT